MLTFTLGNLLVNTLTTLFILTCIFLVLVILIQKPKGGGLSGAFGGAGGGGAVFGAKAGDALTWFTVGAFTCFLLLAIALVYATREEAPTPAVDEDPAVETEQIDPEAEDTPPLPEEGEGDAPVIDTDGDAAPAEPTEGEDEADTPAAPEDADAPDDAEPEQP